MRTPSTALELKAAEFAQEIDDLLGNVLPGPLPQVRSTKIEGHERYVVRPAPTDTSGARSDGREPVPLRVAGVHLANLHVSVHLGLDHTGAYLKALRSDLSVDSVLDRNPLLRLEYRSDMRTDPIAHWQIHAERGAFTHLLTHGHQRVPRMVKRPHDLSSLHLPTGGERFRPCVEDFLQLLIFDCGVDALAGWETALADGRERWRRRQLAAAIRDAPSEAIRVLGDLGYAVAWNREGAVPLRDKSATLRQW